MAVEKIYRCDICGDQIQPEEIASRAGVRIYKNVVTVVRVGTLEDRPEDGIRLEIGSCCAGQRVSALLAAAKEKM